MKCLVGLLSRRWALVGCLAVLVSSGGVLAQQSPLTEDHRRLDWFKTESGDLAPVRTVADWELRKRDVIQQMQEVMGPLPAALQEQPVKYEVLSELAGDGFRRQTITFGAEPGKPVIADLYLPEVAAGAAPRGGIVALHPTGAKGKRIVAGEGPLPNRQYAVELAQRGYVVIAPDYPSFGDQAEFDFADGGYVSGTMKGIVNHMRCVDVLRSLPLVDKNQIGVIGHSLGGHNAMFLAVFDERVKAVVSSCGWTPFHDYYGGQLKGWTSDRYMPRIATEYGLDPDRVPFDFPEIIAVLAPRPFFSASPVSDANFDVAGVKKGIAEASKIYALYEKPDHLVLDMPLCEHDFPTEVRADAYAFLDRALQHTPARELSFGSELPRIAALEPQEAYKSFQIAPGFKMEQTASEPLVVDPVAMSFDENGNLYVIEMRGYSEDDGQNLGRVRVLHDDNGDGKFDRSTVFADQFSWPTAVICYDGGLFVGAAPDIYYLKDTDGDFVADQRDVVFTGFGKKNVQALLNSFRWGLDNRIYGATSGNGGLVRRPEQPEAAALNLSGRNFSFDPKTLEMRPESGAAQHGMSFDDWGRLFVCDNSNHFQMVLYNDHYAARNPFLKSPNAKLVTADDGAQAPVFRTSPVEPWRVVRTRLRASGRVKGTVEFGGQNAGYFTSATGINFFRGDGWPASEKGTAIVGDVGSNIVHRKRVSEDGVLLRGTRIDSDGELVSSRDIWFRPVQYENGPDGALHILDMYREVIEHPWSLPPEIKQHLDLTSGRDRGRLYRIVGENFQQRPTPELSNASTSTLVELLNHPNAWHRETASRLIYERQDPTAVSEIKNRFAACSPLGQLHSLYTLAGLKSLPPELVVAACHSDEPQLRRHGIILSEAFPNDSAVQTAVASLTTDPHAGVRYQLAFSLGEFPDEFNAPLLAKLLVQDGASSWIRFAVLSSVRDQLPAILAQVTAQPADLAAVIASKSLESLIELIARRGRLEDVNSFASDVLANANLSQVEKQKLYRVFALNLTRTSQQSQFAALEQWRTEFLAQARGQAVNVNLPLPQRVSAVQSLTVSSTADDVELLLDLLAPQQPEEVQAAALEALVTVGGTGTDEYLIESWSTLAPALRKQAQQALFARPNWTVRYLKAVLAGEIPRADVDRAQLQVLSNSKSADVQGLCQQVIGHLQDSPRSEVIEKFRPALELTGDIGHGRELFVKHCSSCHQLEGKGKPIGPNLVSFKNRGKETFLINILDPSREVTPDYLNYLVVTTDGRTFTGLLAAQNATTISLQRAEGDPITLLRTDVEEMRSSGISLMPEGLEKELDVAAFSDLLTYLMQTE